MSQTLKCFQCGLPYGEYYFDVEIGGFWVHLCATCTEDVSYVCSQCESPRPVTEFYVLEVKGKAYREKHCKACKRNNKGRGRFRGKSKLLNLPPIA